MCILCEDCVKMCPYSQKLWGWALDEGACEEARQAAGLSSVPKDQPPREDSTTGRQLSLWGDLV